MSSEYMSAGERIKKLRLNLGYSQVELSEILGISKQLLYKYEKGIITNIPSDKVELLADALDTTPSYLMGWTDDPYDYEKDVDARLAECYGPQWLFLLEQCNYDTEEAYKRYVAFKEAETKDALAEKHSADESAYYLDDDAKDLAEFMFNNPEYKVLFDASRNVSKEDIEFVKQMIDRMSGNDGD